MHAHDHLPLDDLQRIAKTITRKRVWVRYQAVILATQGRSAAAIAQALGCSGRCREVDRPLQPGWPPGRRMSGPTPGDGPASPGRCCSTSRSGSQAGPQPEDRVCTLRGRYFKRVPGARVCVLMSLQAVYDLLHRHGFSSLMPRPHHKVADEELQAIFKEVVADQIEAIREVHPNEQVQVWFEDEARFGQQGR